MTRVAAGRQAQAKGERWQTLFQNSAVRQGFHCIRIPDGCRTVQRRLIRVPSPFDFIISKTGLTCAFLDTKTCKTRKFAFSGKVAHQVYNLNLLEKHGLKAGYLVHFQTSSEVVFFPASKLSGMLERTSLGAEDGIILGIEMNFSLERLFL